MPATTRVAVLISGFGSNLQTLIDGAATGELPIELAGVISNKASAYGLERAKAAGIDRALISHRDYESREAFDAALAGQLDCWQPNLIVLAGFMRILSTGFVNQYQNRLMNIHPSLLPAYTGLNTHQRALDAGEQWHGASVHFVIPELDEGPVIVQGKLRINENDDAESLQQRIHKIEHKIYPLAVKWFAEGRLHVKGEQVLLDDKRSDEQEIVFDC